MEELSREGEIRAVGVSNFQMDHMIDLMIHKRSNTRYEGEQHTNRVLGTFCRRENNFLQNDDLDSIAGKYNKSVT